MDIVFVSPGASPPRRWAVAHQKTGVSPLTLQLREELTAGEAYEDGGYVLVDELSRPFKTDKLRREAHRLMQQARRT